MRILITGGSGFIGSHLAEKLLGEGNEVLCIDNYTTGRRDNLSERKGLKLVEGSITNAELMQSLFAEFKPEIIAHCAASYKDPNDWVGDAEVNTKGTAILCKLGKEVGVQRFVYFQTALCYGVKPQQHPIRLDHPILPDNSSYAISKTAGEQYIQLSGIDYVTFRLANVYGPRNLSGPLPIFFKRITAGQQCFVSDTRRDFIFVDDLIECAMGAVEGKGKGAYHVSSGSDVAIIDLYNQTLAAMRINDSRPPELRARHADDAPSILLDPARTEKDFGWKAKTSLSQGIEKAIQYYQTHGIDQTYTHLAVARDKVA